MSRPKRHKKHALTNLDMILADENSTMITEKFCRRTEKGKVLSINASIDLDAYRKLRALSTVIQEKHNRKRCSDMCELNNLIRLVFDYEISKISPDRDPETIKRVAAEVLEEVKRQSAQDVIDHSRSDEERLRAKRSAENGEDPIGDNQSANPERWVIPGVAYIRTPGHYKMLKFFLAEMTVELDKMKTDNAPPDKIKEKADKIKAVQKAIEVWEAEKGIGQTPEVNENGTNKNN